MKRFLSVLLTFLITFCFLSPALGVEKANVPGGWKEGCTVEQTLTGDYGSVTLLWRDGCFSDPAVRDYELWLSRDWIPDSKRLILPSTAAVDGQYPTHRAPDSISLNQDGSILTYVYHFDAPLYNAAGEQLHGKGAYVYTVNVHTQKLDVSYTEAISTETGFFDVTPGDWFAPYVDVCVNVGLMKGTGAGQFSPNSTVTQAEAATIAARLHHILHGGDGTLPKAPEEWGQMTLTFEDGETFSCYYDDRGYRYNDDEVIPSWFRGGRFGGLLYFTRPEGWDGRDYQRLTLTGWTGEMPLRGAAEVINNTGTTLHFIPDDRDREAFSQLIDLPQTSPHHWYRDTDYYLLQNELDFSCAGHSASRYGLVSALNLVVDDLPAINHITDYPDAHDDERETVLRFYNAGILTGTDSIGSFSPDGYLTRAEVAAMAARVLKPELRVEFSPEKPVYRDYVLTLLYTVENFDSHDWTIISSDLLRFYRYDENGSYGEAILRADGTVLELPEGSHLSQYPAQHSDQPYPLLILDREDLTMPGGYSCGVLDPLTGEMVLPFGPYGGYGIYPGDGNCTSVENGRFFITKEAVWDRETWMSTCLRDDKGNILRELPTGDGLDSSDWGALCDGLTPSYDAVTRLWGYRDMDGKWAIPPLFDQCYFFYNGRAIVSRNGGNGVIDAQGREIIPCEHYDLEYRGDGLYRSGGFSSNSYWLREDGSTLKNGYLNYDIFLHNGYIGLNGRYLDQDFQYATPADFQWAGPITADGMGFVGLDNKIYRIEFQK